MYKITRNLLEPSGNLDVAPAPELPATYRNPPKPRPGICTGISQKPSKTLTWHLHRNFREPSGTLQNLAHNGTLRNLDLASAPEPSGTLRNLAPQRAPERTGAYNWLNTPLASLLGKKSNLKLHQHRPQTAIIQFSTKVIHNSCFFR